LTNAAPSRSSRQGASSPQLAPISARRASRSGDALPLAAAPGARAHNAGDAVINMDLTSLAATLKTPQAQQALRLAFCVTGIVCSLLVYGVLQERIMTQARARRGVARAQQTYCAVIGGGPLAAAAPHVARADCGAAGRRDGPYALGARGCGRAGRLRSAASPAPARLGRLPPAAPPGWAAAPRRRPRRPLRSPRRSTAFALAPCVREHGHAGACSRLRSERMCNVNPNAA
jgi:putative hemolysin